ncbi:MAG: LysM peptidoglycan-binding domain-containing protein [Saprospiraceae bacterium]|nr:LysM peptidoglycan-binding domain-containing protein [Saprospiraceae bacterium]
MINLPSKKLDLDFIKSGKLEKMKITAYSDADFKDKLKFDKNGMEVLINPEAYTIDYKIKVSEDKALGANGALLKYEHTEPSEMSFEFLFDCTGIIDGNAKNDVTEEIKDFKKIVYDYNGDFHETPFVQLAWGWHIFQGRLTSLSIQYKLFSSTGMPIRALAKATFKASISEEKQAVEAKKSSPDLTHVVLVKAGDTLPLLCNRIYENPKYYLQVAKINRLGNFRQLEPGMELVFPPVDKISSKLA